VSTRGKTDPTLGDVLRCINGIPAVAIERSSGVSASTVRAWRNGKTMSPQNKTLEFAIRAAGFKRVIVRA
jgi:hypothetical protein